VPLDADWIITNPPFGKAELFIRHALHLKPRGGVAMLVKSQFWHAKRRHQLFLDCHPDYVCPLTWRPDFLFGAKSGSPTMEVVWSIWKSPYATSRTIYEPLTRRLEQLHRTVEFIT
jgi:hypothetical protein